MAYDKFKLFINVFLLHLCYAGSHIISRAALNLGISKVVFLVYRNIIAIVLLAPFAYFLEKRHRPPLTFSILMQFVLLSLCGITASQGFYLLGLYYLSPTYVSAIQNSMPAITFAMAASIRLEQLNITNKYGIAKVVGTLICVGGATIITLYKGPPLLQGQPHLTMGAFSDSNVMNWTLGCVYIIMNCLAWAAWMVLQVPVLKVYPAKLTVTTITCFFGLIQLIGIAAFCESDIARWKIHSEGELISIIYAGVVGSGLCFSLQIWCIHRAGPLFVAVFQPLQTVMVAVLATIILGERLYSGGLIGFVFIMAGLYTVLWGKNEEKKVGMVGTQDLTTHLLEQEENPHKGMP